MKKTLLALTLMLSACSSVDRQVRLVGECNDPKAEVRFEVYIRAVNFGDETRLKHSESPVLLSESDTRKFILHIKREDIEKSITDTEVMKENEAEKTRISPPIRLEPK